MMAFHGRRGVGHAMVRKDDDIHNVRHVGDVQPLSQVLHTPVQLHVRSGASEHLTNFNIKKISQIVLYTPRSFKFSNVPYNAKMQECVLQYIYFR